MKNGIFYAVSVGPGDPELLTRKACRILEAAPVIAAPQTKSGTMLALDIAKGAVSLDGKDILPLEFTMSRDTELRRASYRAGAAAISQKLLAGLDVAMVNLGDVSVYATAYYILEELRSMGFETQMVPGVPSFCAVAAQLQRSLTRPESPLHILPAGAENWEASLDLPGTKVLMKSGRNIREAASALEQRGLAEKSAMVADCGLATQQVFETMENLPENISYFATVLVPEEEA